MIEEISYKIKLNIEYNKDKTKRFRYEYSKVWNENKKLITAILLNPSKADKYCSDKTLDVLTKTFYEKGYGGFIVLNLFAYMQSKSSEIKNTDENKEKINYKHIKDYLEKNKNTEYFIGWGNDFGYLYESIKNSAKTKKKYIENFFRVNNMKSKIKCFRSDNGKALHPAKFSESWDYADYFLR